MNGSGPCLISGACLISGSCLISGEVSGSRLIRFELGGSARAALHAAHLPRTYPSACRKSSRCTPRSCLSACRGGRGCTLGTSFSPCRGRRGCSPRTCFSASREGKGCSPRSGVSPCHADTGYTPCTDVFAFRASIASMTSFPFSPCVLRATSVFAHAKRGVVAFSSIPSGNKIEAIFRHFLETATDADLRSRHQGHHHNAQHKTARASRSVSSHAFRVRRKHNLHRTPIFPCVATIGPRGIQRNLNSC